MAVKKATSKTPARAASKVAAVRAEDAYRALLADVAKTIDEARTEAVRRSNAVVIDLYARVGRLILERQRDERYGSGLELRQVE